MAGRKEHFPGERASLVVPACPCPGRRSAGGLAGRCGPATTDSPQDGLDQAVSAALAPWRKPQAVSDSGKILLDVALAVAVAAWPMSGRCGPRRPSSLRRHTVWLAASRRSTCWPGPASCCWTANWPPPGLTNIGDLALETRTDQHLPSPRRVTPSRQLTGEPRPATTRRTLENPTPAPGLRHDRAPRSRRPPAMAPQRRLITSTETAR